MIGHWQDVAALGLVMLAAGYVTWCGWRAGKKRCGGCGCAGTAQPSERVLVEIQLDRKGGP